MYRCTRICTIRYSYVHRYSHGTKFLKFIGSGAAVALMALLASIGADGEARFGRHVLHPPPRHASSDSAMTGSDNRMTMVAGRPV